MARKRTIKERSKRVLYRPFIAKMPMSNFAPIKVTAPDRPSDPLLDPPQDWNYEATVAVVEGILAKIESGKLELAEVFTEFSIAVEYLRQCEAFLGDRQKQVDLLIETLTDDPEF